MQSKPVLNTSFPLLVTHPGGLREAESPKHPAEQHTHLHQCQILPGANGWSVREREERRCVVHSHRYTRAEPSFGQECFWVVKVTWVTLNAVRVENELCLFRNDPAHAQSNRIGCTGVFDLQFSEQFRTFALAHSALRPT